MYSQMLASYLASNPVWQEMITVLEKAYGLSTRELALYLANIRDLFQLRDPQAAAIQAEIDSGATTRDLQTFDAYQTPDRATLVKTCSMLGFTYPDTDDDLFTSEDYLRIAQNIADYYKEQGTEAFLRFFSYCLNNNFTLEPMWTSDYATFYPEGSPFIGTPIWAGGTWYPTSHVQFQVEPGQDKVDPSTFQKFFNYIAPINLVLLGTVFRLLVNTELKIAMHGRMRVIHRSRPPQVTALVTVMHARQRVHQL